MIVVIKSKAELAKTVRRIAKEKKLYREQTIGELHQVADILEKLAEEEDKKSLVKSISE
jgi:hypothetical protein